MDILKSAIKLMSSKDEDPKDPKKPKYPKRVVVFAEKPPETTVFENNKPVLKKYDEFVKEANNLVNFYNRVSPSTVVEIMPVYNDEKNQYGAPTNKPRTNIYNKLSELTPDDDVVILGHRGNKFAGIPVENWAQMLEQSNYGNCALGSCGSGDIAKGPWKSVRNLIYRPSSQWLGVNANAKDFVSAMFSRVDDPNKVTEFDEFSRPINHPSKIVKPVKGQDYEESRGSPNLAVAQAAERARMAVDLAYRFKTDPVYGTVSPLDIPFSLANPAKKVDPKNVKKVQSTLSNKKKK